MIVKVYERNIEIPEEWCERYKKHFGTNMDAGDIKNYVSAIFHPVDIRKHILSMSDKELQDTVYKCLKWDINM